MAHLLPEERLPEFIVDSAWKRRRGACSFTSTSSMTGEVLSRASMVTPTSQNLWNMEDDVNAYLPGLLDKSREEIVLELDKPIRSYAPCVSCCTHFLEVGGL